MDTTSATPRPKFKIDLNEPHQIYKNAMGKRLPGVTTVNGILDKAALRGWYADMERESVVRVASALYEQFRLKDRPGPGTPVEKWTEMLRHALGDKWAADVKKDRAADIGTVTHARCEAFLKGMDLDEEGLDAELLDKSTNGFVRFHDWWTSTGLTVVHSELQMVSERWQVGGTADIIARDPLGAFVLVDLKTSKASKWWPYPEVFGQVAAYAAMYEETHPDTIEHVYVARIGKEENDPGQTYHLTAQERAAGGKLFMAALAAYNAKKELGR